MRNLALLIWYAVLLLVVGSAIHVAYGVEFPVRDPSTGLTLPAGMCMDWVRILADQYPDSQITYAYEPGSPGHVWLIVDGQPIDSYFGPQTATYEWVHPAYSFGSYAELQAAI